MSKVNLEDLTYGQIKELVSEFSQRVTSSHIEGSTVWQIGANYLIRTVTMTDTGRLVEVTEHELVLEDAA